MLALPHTNSWGFIYSNVAGGATLPGTIVAPGTSNAEGSWVELLPDASITTDIQYITFGIWNGSSSAVAKNHLIDFGIDPAGGTSYVAFFSNLACGMSSGTAGCASWFHFPVTMPAGSAGAFRIQGSDGTAGSPRIICRAYGKPSRPELWRKAAYSETVGTITNSNGVSFTPGNGSFGSWASLGTTAKKHFWAQLGMQIDNGTVTGEGCRVQLGIGDGTNMHVITDFLVNAASSEQLFREMQVSCQWEIPAGAELWVRGYNSGAPVSGFNATAVLFGG